MLANFWISGAGWARQKAKAGKVKDAAKRLSYWFSAINNACLLIQQAGQFFSLLAIEEEPLVQQN
jgi:hypothetical protein